MSPKKKILVIDDDKPILDMLGRQLGNQGYEVIGVSCGKDGIEKIKSEEFDAVITDVRMPDMDGLSVISEIKKINPNIEVIVSTGFGSMEVAVESIKVGAFDFVNKPFGIEEMAATVKKAVDSYHSKKMISLLNDNLNDAYLKLEQARDGLEEKVQERTKELALSEKKYRSIIDGSFDPIILLDKSMQIISWNKGAELTFGFKETEMQSKPFEFLIADEKNNFRRSFGSQLENQDFLKNKITRCITNGNETIYVNITASKLENEETSIILRDITQEKKVDQMKTDFVSNVSHELRTPLTSIKGAVELVLGGSEGEIHGSAKELLEIARNNTIRLIKLISNLLDISKIESGKIEMEIKPCDVLELIQETLKEIKPVTDKKNLSLTLVDKVKNHQIHCDKDRIKQVIINLITNAAKFTTEKASIQVSLEENEKEIKISVIDTGMGISQENIKKLFERFQQVDSSSTRKQGGTGLGLSISKSIVEAHKGKIWVESELNKGSTFSFTILKGKEELPVAAVVKAGISAQPVDSKHLYSVKRILVVDDEEDLARVIRGHLEKKGYEVIVANSGLDAVKKAVELKPQLITLDILMPNMDGYSVAEILKQNPKTKDIPIVVVSVLFEKERGYKLGVSDYITKPFEPEQLYDSIKKIENQMSKDMQKKKVLIVDDDPDIVAVLSMSMHEKDYFVLNAYDGLQAISLTKKEKPDIVVLDLMLPEIDGFEVIKALKEDPETKDIPILVVTARTIEDRIKAIKMGVEEYLIKPFTLRTLFEELDKILKTEEEKKEGKTNG